MTLSASLTSIIYPSRGFHFEYSTDASQLSGVRPDCSLFLLHVLPPDVFVDKYELQERGLDFNLYGESDLERPLIAMDDTGSTLEIRVPASMTANVPLHARYPLPSNSTHSSVRVPFPQAYWACPGTSKRIEMHCQQNLMVFKQDTQEMILSSI
ncbi:PIG-X [Hysterangium stoloniferum]|nr:PIG-X [Hysterangium stoloniferum]